MTLEEKVGQLIQLSADFFGTDQELTGPAQSENLSAEQLAAREVRFTVTEPMLRFRNAENRFVSEAGAFTLFVGYADHAYLADSFRLV